MSALQPKYAIKPLDPHGYEIDGAPVPSVTEILEDLGLSDYSFVPEDDLDWAKDRGSAVHTATHFYDDGDLNDDDLDDRVRPHVEAYKNFREDTGFEPTHIEIPVWHPVNRYAGTLDRIGVLNGVSVLVDLKSGQPPPTVGLQTAAYQLAAKCTYDLTPVKRFSLWLKDDGRYKLDPLDNWHDFDDFLSLVNTWYIKKGIKKRNNR